MPPTIVRSGRQRIALAASPVQAADVLSNPVAVTALLGDLLDQSASSVGPPTRWVIPPIHVGPRALRTTLEPTFARAGVVVDIDAPTTAGSDTRARLRLRLEARQDVTGCTLETAWQLDLRVPLPRAALLLARPAIDRVITRTVVAITQRSAWAVEQSARGV